MAVSKEACFCTCCLALLMGRNELCLKSFTNRVALPGGWNMLESSQ